MTVKSGSGAAPKGDIAIVGMSCLFAGAPNLETYWRNILTKVDAISDPPEGEWDPKIFYDPASTSNDRVYCKRGGYIGDLAEFQPLDFGVMPITVDGGEPDQWLALKVAHEALGDAGYTEAPKEHQQTEVILGKGTYINRGNLTVGYHGMVIEHFLHVLRDLHPEYTNEEIKEIKRELKAGLPPFSANTAPALIGNIMAGRIANRLDLMGPSFTVDAACASALVAIDIGVRNLLSGKCDLVLAGGANANAPLPTMSLFCQLGALSRKEKIRPFDKDADGTILGEGLGMIVMKRREDAERDGNRIYALVRGVGIASDGRALHVMAPRIEGEELALRRAYNMAGVDPASVGLIEAHGTATPVGDVVEVQALSRIFGERKKLVPSCALGSVKSMIGHTMPAAGIAGVIKTALALHHRILPPTLHFEEANPALRLSETPFYVNTETRPWIHGAETPRRAGVNSFGFGGINGHVVLEEYPESALQDQADTLPWDTEAVILEGASRQELKDRAQDLIAFLSGTAAANVTLTDIAYTLNTQLQDLACRISVVAQSLADLVQKLGHAVRRLDDPKCRQIKDSRGIYFFDEPLGGKLAFLFPGEGSQYPNMLLDLCLHFPEVRSCFDLADRALVQGARDWLPSDLIFPRSTLPAAEAAEMAKRLWEIDGAVESVLVANRALWTLLKRLEIKPDVILGHSTGDYSAMLASGIIELSDEDEYAKTMLVWNQAHGRIEKEMAVPEAMLLAVAADAGTVNNIMKDLGEEFYLAMDNCPHQSVMVGSKETIERATELLRQRGLIFELLPFDRPYHTPLFRAYAEGAALEFFSHLRISPARIETYSCTTAAPYPPSVEEIRNLYIAHWVEPVRFTETIQKMHEDGVRLFVEVGPRGNLTSFVSDILRDKPHLGVPANVPRRSGTTQINHLVGILAAQGVPMKLEYLYQRRKPRRVPLQADASAAVAKPRPVPMKVLLAMPPIRVTPRKPKPKETGQVWERSAPLNDKDHAGRGVTSLRTVVRADLQNRNEPVHAVAPVEDSKPGTLATPEEEPTHEAESTRMPPSGAEPQSLVLAGTAVPTRVDPSPVRGASAQAVSMFLQNMDSFLDVEQQVMQSYLRRANPPTATQSTVAIPSKAAGTNFPLLGTVTSITPGQELTAIRRLTLEEDVFLREHSLGSPVSVNDPAMQPMMVVPLTMSMELLAEAAAALLPGMVVTGMEDVRAHHWIRVEDTPVELRTVARRLPGAAERVDVQVWNASSNAGEASARPVVQGIVQLGKKYPQPFHATAFSLAEERPSALAASRLYNGRTMFHGPCFQGVASVDRTALDGVTGTLRILNTDRMFRSNEAPAFVTDPVALDAAGQLVGFWAAEQLARGFVVFPYRLGNLRIYGPNQPVGSMMDCRVRVQMLGEELLRSNISITGVDGLVWMELDGWEDRRFDPPPRFHRAWTAPHKSSFSEEWAFPVLQDLRPHTQFACRHMRSPFRSGESFWTDLWSSLVLSRQEKQFFQHQRWTGRRQLEWLAGRTAAKDAARALLKAQCGLDLLPADIGIDVDEHGQPLVNESCAPDLSKKLHISISHSEGEAVALATVGAGVKGCGIDLQKVRALSPGFADVAFPAADEKRLLTALPPAETHEWLIRMWSAKEAVGKALGRGLPAGPGSVRIASLDRETGALHVAPTGVLATGNPDVAGLTALTSRDGEYILATCIWEGDVL